MPDDAPLALGAVSAARRRLPSITLAASVATLSILATTPSLAAQTCSAAPASSNYWSWRIIDGRKCWYKGKPMLSKSLLAWPTRSASSREPSREESGRLHSNTEDTSSELATALAEKHGDPLDAQARAADDSDTFEALWRARIERH
jgi:hypothetical protein